MTDVALASSIHGGTSDGYPDDSWFWPILAEYRDREGRTLREAEHHWLGVSGRDAEAVARAIDDDQWNLSPKCEMFVRYLLEVIETRFARNEEFTYLEFGTCFGTTITNVLRYFHRAKGIGLEVTPERFEVGSWLANRVDESYKLGGRLQLRCSQLTQAMIEPNSIDVVFMDTDHRYPDDYEYVMYLLDQGILRHGFLFVGDDPMHTGTCQARERFIAQQSDKFGITTSPQKNLWWFEAH